VRQPLRAGKRFPGRRPDRRLGAALSINPAYAKEIENILKISGGFMYVCGKINHYEYVQAVFYAAFPKTPDTG
jgi:hypothetical protein